MMVLKKQLTGTNKIFNSYFKSREFKFLMFVFVLGVLIRLFGLKRSLNFDEGQYITISWLISKGLILYKDVFTNKPFGIFYFLLPLFWFIKNKLYLIFVARIFTIVIQCISIFPLFYIAKTLNRKIAFIVPIIFVFENYGYHWGKYIMTEQFAITFLIFSIYFLFRYFKEEGDNSLYISLVLIIISVLFKQTGIIGLPLYLLAIFLKKGGLWKKIYKSFLYVLLIIFIVYIFIIRFIPYNDLVSGIYTVNINLNYVLNLTLIKTRINAIIKSFLPLHPWVYLSVLSFVVMFWYKKIKLSKFSLIVIVWFLLDSFFFISVPSINYGYSGFSHYWIQIIPSSLLAGMILANYLPGIFNLSKRNNIVSILFLTLMIISLFRLLKEDIKVSKINYPGGTIQDEFILTNDFFKKNLNSGKVIMQFFTNYYYYLDEIPGSKFIEFGSIYLSLGDYYNERYYNDLLDSEVMYYILPRRTYENITNIMGEKLGNAIKDKFQLSDSTTTKYDNGTFEIYLLKKK